MKNSRGVSLLRRHGAGFYLRRRQSLGFTFLELLVVFSIMGILTSLGFASFVSYSKKQVLDQAVQDLKTGIDQAKFNAVSRVKPIVAPCSITTPLDRYRIRICTSSVACSSPADLYEIDAGCVVGGATQWTTSVLASKKRPATISTVSGCIMQFSVLSGIDGPCMIVLMDGSVSKTLCVDGGGNTSVLDGSSTRFQACVSGTPTTLTPTTVSIPTTPTPTPTSAPTCTPYTCLSYGNACGYHSDGCSSQIYCGACATPTPTPTPTPSCTNGYKDNDNDGYGAGPYGCYTGTVVQNNTDCDDTTSQVYPGNPYWYQYPVASTGPKNGTYDYNCDGTVTPYRPGPSLSGTILSGYNSFSYSGVCTAASLVASQTYTTTPISCGQFGYLTDGGGYYLFTNSTCSAGFLAGYYAAFSTGYTQVCH